MIKFSNEAMEQKEKDRQNRQYAMNLAMAGMAGQVGCITLFIVFGALISGLWLDQQLGTRPMLTIFLILVSAPAALGLTFWLAMRAVNRIKPLPSKLTRTETKKEENAGE